MLSRRPKTERISAVGTLSGVDQSLVTSLRAVLEPVAVVFGADDLGVTDQPVDHGGDGVA